MRCGATLAGEPGVHTQQAAFGPEPTVTISTQAAFSTLNDMFRADLPHEGVRISRGPAAMHDDEPMQKRPASAEGFPMYEDTQLLPTVVERARRARPDGSQPIQMYEDTQFLGSPVPSPLNASPELQLYEDTQFMQENSAAMPARHRNAQPMQPCSAGLQVFKDTSHMQEGGPKAGQVPSPLNQPAAPEMQLYEDTQFMQENSAAVPASHRDAQPMQTGSPGLQVFEDTGLMQENGPNTAAPSPGFQLYEDTQFISAPRAGSGCGSLPRQPLLPSAGFPAVDSMGTPVVAGGHEGHTAFLAENVRPPTPATPESFDSPTKNKARKLPSNSLPISL